MKKKTILLFGGGALLLYYFLNKPKNPYSIIDTLPVKELQPVPLTPEQIAAHETRTF